MTILSIVTKMWRTKQHELGKFALHLLEKSKNENELADIKHAKRLYHLGVSIGYARSVRTFLSDADIEVFTGIAIKDYLHELLVKYKRSRKLELRAQQQHQRKSPSKCVVGEEVRKSQ